MCCDVNCVWFGLLTYSSETLQLVGSERRYSVSDHRTPETCLFRRCRVSVHRAVILWFSRSTRLQLGRHALTVAHGTVFQPIFERRIKFPSAVPLSPVRGLMTYTYAEGVLRLIHICHFTPCIVIYIYIYSIVIQRLSLAYFLSAVFSGVEAEVRSTTLTDFSIILLNLPIAMRDIGVSRR